MTIEFLQSNLQAVITHHSLPTDVACTYEPVDFSSEQQSEIQQAILHIVDRVQNQIQDKKLNVFVDSSNNRFVKVTTLESDTENIIEYVENNVGQNKKTYHFWKLLTDD